MSLSSIPSYLLRVAASWLTGCFCMFAWWLIYLASDNLCIGQLMTEIFKQADHNLSTIMCLSLPVGIVLGEILTGIWELIVSPLFEDDRNTDNADRTRNLCSRPFEYFVTGLGNKLMSENCIGKGEKGNITIGEFASMFNCENAHNASEIHFALARCLGGISIGLAGGLIWGLLLMCKRLVGASRKLITCACCVFCHAVISTLSIVVILMLVVFILDEIKVLQTIQALIMIFICIVNSFVAFRLSLRYRDFANFIIVISKRCDAPLGKTKN